MKRASIIPDRNRKLDLELAGIRFVFDLEGADAEFLRKARERYRGFRPGKKAKPGFSFRLEFRELKQEPFRPAITLKGRLLSVSRGDFSCEADLVKKSGILLTRPSVYSFDSFLRVFLSFLLLRENGFLVHAAALRYGGRAFLLAGKSGSGKSTVSRLARRKALILSDELVPVRLGKNSATVFSSPFWGEMEGRGKAFKKKLSGLFLLRKSGMDFRTKPDAGEFLSSFLRCVMNFSKDPALSEKAVKKTAALWRLLEPEKLYFSKESPAFLKLL